MRGASASWTMKMRSPGMARIVSTSIRRASVWKESRISPMFGMVGAPHDLPGVAMVVDVAAPGQRLVADAQAALRRPLAELAEIGGGAVDAAQRERRDVGADQHQVGAELLHQVELALGAVEGARALRLGHALEIAERLEQRDLQAVIADHAADFARRAVEGEEIVLEDLDAVEAGRGDRRELLAQIAADRHGGDRGLHGHASFDASASQIARSREPQRHSRAARARR